MEGKEPNCIGFAFQRLGLKKTERFIPFPLYEDFVKNFLVTGKEDDDVICVILKPKNPQTRIVHLAIVDSTDRNFIVHRAWSGAPISRLSRDELSKLYSSEYFLMVNLKLIEKHKA